MLDYKIGSFLKKLKGGFLGQKDFFIKKLFIYLLFSLGFYIRQFPANDLELFSAK
jgi:hypothetical protein